MYPRRIPNPTVLSALGLLAIGLLAVMALGLWTAHGPVAVVRHDLRAAGASGTPWRLVQISDLHLQALGPREQALARRVSELAADVVVLSGDAIDRADALPALHDFVKALGDVPVLLVPGNWEHWSGLELTALQRSLAEAGARLLLNERWSLARGGRRLLVLGLDDFSAGAPDLQLLDTAAVAPHDAKAAGSLQAVLVQHSPAFFEQAAVAQRMGAHRFSLCLAGHTHGGQIAWGPWAPLRPAGSGRFVAGFYEVPGCRLFVSRGVGTSVLPLRLGAPPEVVVFEL